MTRTDALVRRHAHPYLSLAQLLEDWDRARALPLPESTDELIESERRELESELDSYGVPVTHDSPTVRPPSRLGTVLPASLVGETYRAAMGVAS